ncbi:MAG: LysR family transcriptional regulator [Paracoccaceae bacterium]|nr:MAG: LysR family transcriptional regulator [Paracoccaceae bacterium]
MGFDNWDEVRTAFQVARLGTVSGAAEVLGVHHATVIRHIDALEKRLGVRLFQRHPRGYTPTEAGRDLLAVAQVTQEQFAQLAGRIRGQGESVTGELVVTSISGLAPILAPVLASFRAAHPGLIVRFLSDLRLFRLDFGEAHVAIRAGAAPSEPDNVAQPFLRLRNAPYASTDYVAARGKPATEADLAAHDLVGADDPQSRAPFSVWMRDHLPEDRVVFRASEQAGIEAAVRAGAGIGFMPVWQGDADPALVQILPPRPEWDAPLWLVTHVDLHRTLKVQRFLAHLKEAAKGWQGL